jgi:hypothetical protein
MQKRMTPKQSIRAFSEPADDRDLAETDFSTNLVARKAARAEEQKKPPKRGKSREDC